MQMNMIRFLGFKKADAIATSLQKEVTMRKRETRQQPASVCGQLLDYNVRGVIAR